MMKKLLSLAVCICLTLACLCPMNISAQAAQTDNTCGSNLTWELTDEGALITSSTKNSITLQWNVEDCAKTWSYINGNSYKYWVTVVKDGKSLVYSTTNTTFTVAGFDPATCTVSICGINSHGVYDYDAVQM